MLEVVQDPSFNQLTRIKHGFFTRLGGVSTGIYTSLNCAYPSRDDPAKVRENRRRVAAYFDQPFEALITVKNIHSNIAVIVDKPWAEADRQEADGLVTQLPQLVLGSDNADCPIVLFADQVAGVVGLAHAGWKGARGGIIEATVQKMLSLGSRSQDIYAAVSPCIAQDSYEVGGEFYQCFIEESASHQQYFKLSSRPQHFLFNLLGYVNERLLRLNLKAVSTAAAVDTYKDQRFFSFRRSTHQGDKLFGCNFSCVSLLA